MKALKTMIQEVSDHPAACNFLEPVPWKELGLTNYLQLISKPMDLETCK